jgi:hypothetical protein
MRTVLLVGLLLQPAAAALAQQPASLRLDTIYVCPTLQVWMKVHSCEGPGPSDLCDVTTGAVAKPPMRGKSRMYLQPSWRRLRLPRRLGTLRQGRHPASL